MERAAVPSMIREQRLNQWIENYSDSILRTCFLYLSDQNQAEDATQDIMGGAILKRLLLLLTTLIMILSASIVFAEEDPDAVIREWEEKYGDQRLWDYLINAAFAEQESWRYAWNPSMRPMLPDQDAISAEEAEKLAIQLIPQYGSEINAERLESLTCVVSSYRKPENDTGSYWSTNGTWIIDFWDTRGEEPLSVCTICIDAHTGIPSALLLPS